MKIYLENYNGVTQDLAPHFELTNLKEADVVVLWQDIFNPDVINSARHYNKPIVVVGHSYGAVEDYLPPNSFPFKSDKLLVWGQYDLDKIKDSEFKDKVILTGTPSFKHLKPRVPHTGINVVYAPAHWHTEIEENLLVAQKLRKSGFNIITKLVDEAVHKPEYYDNPVVGDRNTTEHLSVIADVLSQADAVVSMTDETFALFAHSLDIPVVCPAVWKPKIPRGTKNVYVTQYSDAVELTLLENLNQTITETLENPAKRAEQRKKLAVYRGGVEIPDPLERIIAEIKQMK